MVSFRHDLAGSSGFSADAHRHQVSFGLSFKQVGLRFIHPLRFGSTPPHPRLFRQTPFVQHIPLLVVFVFVVFVVVVLVLVIVVTVVFVGLLQIINVRDRPLAKDHPEGLPPCK